jgi:hypothetical protein
VLKCRSKPVPDAGSVSKFAFERATANDRTASRSVVASSVATSAFRRLALPGG